MVLNENEVLELLVSRGFQAVTMDGRTVVEQAALLSRAECVVAPHGAALANLVFAPPGTTVVELTNNNWPHPVFRHIAATMGFRYVAIVGDEPRSPAWLGSPWIIDADNVVNIERLTRALDEAAVC